MTFNEKMINYISSLFKKNKTNSAESKAVELHLYSKGMEKHKKKIGNNYFELPFVQKRYDHIIETLKYTKHSKRREKLLKSKRIYDKILAEK